MLQCILAHWRANIWSAVKELQPGPRYSTAVAVRYFRLPSACKAVIGQQEKRILDDFRLVQLQLPAIAVMMFRIGSNGQEIVTGYCIVSIQQAKPLLYGQSSDADCRSAVASEK